ncbi:hypothetical protein RCCGEPOP_02381 [Rhizobium sp. Pop5]|nr:hypothetical protein RCCGEPOP_02381 [Rhizobium sp. Pop5]
MDFPQVERFGDVIVGADFETDDPVNDIVAARQHHDRDIGLGTDFASKVKTVGAAGEDEIEQDGVKILLTQAYPHLGAVRGGRDRVTLALEIARQHLANPRIIIDNEKMRVTLSCCHRHPSSRCSLQIGIHWHRL